MFFFEHHGIRESESFNFFTSTNLSFPLHFHRAYEIIIVKNGQLRLSIDQKTYTLNKNDVAFIFPNQLHQLETINNSTVSIIIFSPELIGYFYMKFKSFLPENNVLHLNKLPNLKNLNSIYRQKSLLYGLCDDLVNHTTFIPIKYSNQMKLLQQILVFIDNNYQGNCTLKKVSAYLKYDYAYLSKLFVKMTKMTFTEYLNFYRISQACYLLKNSQKPVNEIAFDCGFNNLRTFHRNFKKITKTSPKLYREN